MATWLITGATGFLGRPVLDLLAGDTGRGGAPEGDTLVVLGHHRPLHWPEGQFVCCDLNDPDRLLRTIEEVAPDYVVHTAGRTPPALDEELYRGNFWATVRLLNAARAAWRPMRIVLTGSAAELGPVPTERLPVDESYPCRPIDAYGRSKWLATVAGLAERPPLEVMIARVFNPIGPGLSPSQAFGRFAAELAIPGPDPLPLQAGGLDPKRDFIDVRDAARAIVALALRGKPGQVYHVGTGESRSVGEGLDRLVALSGRQVRVSLDPRRGGRKGPADSRANIARIVEQTGWSPSIPFEQSLADLWEAARARTDATSGLPAPRLPLTA